jgi:RNA polymerase sigma factor (sigma-70 family)
LTADGFASFFHHLFSRTVIMLMAMGASRAEAEDATQEALILAWRKWDSISEPAAWVRTTASRIFWRRARKRCNQVVLLGDEIADQAATETDLAVFTEEQQNVLRLLRALPARQRAVAALYYDGMSYEEIADLLGSQPNTVRSQLRHARKKLIEVMASDPS